MAGGSVSILCCADLYGSKCNLEVPFACMPTMGELMQKVKDYFEHEGNLVKPPGAPVRPFTVGRMQVFNDATSRWDDLVRPDQLAHHAQVYVFQPNIPDIQSDLPAPRPASHPDAQRTLSGAGGASPSPAGYGYSQPQGVAAAFGERPNVPAGEKLQMVFRELDGNGKGFLDYGDLERGFKQRGLHFAVNTIGELFHKADLNRDGRIEYREWEQWGQVYPNTLDAMYYRGRDTGEEAQIRNQMKELQDQNDAEQLAQDLLADMLRRAGSSQQLANCIKCLDRHIAPAAQAVAADPNRDVRPDIQRALEDCNREMGNRERMLPELEQRMRAAQERRHVLEQQEMNLLEQEIRLERQRDAMRAQEAKYAEAESMFNSKADGLGSPRRARRIIGPSSNAPADYAQGGY